MTLDHSSWVKKIFYKTNSLPLFSLLYQALNFNDWHLICVLQIYIASKKFNEKILVGFIDQPKKDLSPQRIVEYKICQNNLID